MSRGPKRESTDVSRGPKAGIEDVLIEQFAHEERVEAMFEAGLVREVKQLLASYGELGRTAMQAVGYREVVEHLNGERDLDETIQQVVYHTRRFARRQETWFRGFPECQQISMTSEMTAEDVVDIIIGLAEQGQ